MNIPEHKSSLNIAWSAADQRFLVSLKDGPQEGFKVNLVSFNEHNSTFFIAMQLHKLIEPWTKTDEYVDELRKKTDVLKEEYNDLQKKHQELLNDHIELLGFKKGGKIAA